jgi:hypothetical protein
VPIFHPEWWYEKKKDVESEEGTDDVEYQNSDKEQEMPSKSKGENRANETVVIKDKKKDIERQLV